MAKLLDIKKKSSDGEVMYFSKLFHATVQLHIMHFQTLSFSQHKALEEAYEELGDLMDELIEIRQGEAQTLFTNYVNIPYVDNSDPIMYLQGLLEDTKSYREGKTTNVQNLSDEILSVIDRTIYKLKFLQ